MPRKKKLQFKLSDEALNDMSYLSKFEPFLPLHLFKMRIISLTGYRFLREEMTEATDEEWTYVYDLYLKSVK